MLAKTKLDSFFEWLRSQNLAAPMVKLTTRTKPKLLAASRAVFPEGVERVATRLGQCGMSYENCVKNLTGDETFIAESLWSGAGEHVEGNRYLVRHKATGKLYIVFRPRESKDGDIMVTNDQWFDVKTKECISKPIEFLPKESPSKTGVSWRTISVEAVERIECGATFDFTSCGVQ